MSAVAEAQSKTQASLAEAVQGFKLPAEVMGQAAQLLTRLNQPTRVSLLGLPKSGKTGIFNLLAGQLVLPEGLSSSVQLVHGDEPRAHVTLSDGTNLTLDGMPDLERIGAMTPVFVKLEMDLPALRKISLLEVVTGTERAEQQRAIKWAMKQTDIGIWCTEDFTATEQALWASAADEVKDHAILLRTRADLIETDRSTVVNGLRDDLGDNFAFFMAVSAQEAQVARAGETIDKAQMKASGASSLISTILRQIERGRQTAVDQADILLMKHAKAKTPAVEAAPEPAETAPDVAPEEKVHALKEDATPDAAVEQAVEPADTPAAIASPEPIRVKPTAKPKATDESADDFAFFASTRAEVSQQSLPMASLFNEQQPEPNAPAEATPPNATEPEVHAEPAPEQPAGPDLKETWTLALDRLSDTGEAIATFNPEDSKKILRASGKTLEWLMMHLDDAELSQSEAVTTVQAMVQDAADLVQLLKAEGGDDVSREAVTALLQVKRSIQAELAA